MINIINKSPKNKESKVQKLTIEALKTNRFLGLLSGVNSKFLIKPIHSQINGIRNGGLNYCKLQLKHKLILLKRYDLAVDLFFLYVKLDMRKSVTTGYSDSDNVDFWYNHLQKRIDNNIGDQKDNKKRQLSLLGTAQDISIIENYKDEIDKKSAYLDKLIDKGDLISYQIESLKS